MAGMSRSQATLIRCYRFGRSRAPGETSLPPRSDAKADRIRILHRADACAWDSQALAAASGWCGHEPHGFGLAISTAARRLDCSDVDLFHRHHRLERALGDRAI